MQELFEQGIKLGVSLSRSSCGTTAVGYVLETGELSVVNTEEHAWTACHPWTCIAAPVTVDEERLGVVCIMLKIDGKINHCKIVLQLLSDSKRNRSALPHQVGGCH
ncbi:GAF domain-containing protein [Gorillibacterium timonense]|uniref:GAF domain-containing protein n=1 Tax=Gorillibacterium timonense TaxID=1689269 RepID=UPI0037099A9B